MKIPTMLTVTASVAASAKLCHRLLSARSELTSFSIDRKLSWPSGKNVVMSRVVFGVTRNVATNQTSTIMTMTTRGERSMLRHDEVRMR